MGGCIDNLRSFPFFQVWKFIKAWMTTKFRRCRLSHLKGRLDWSSFLCAISWQIYNEKHKVSWGLCLAAPAHSLCLWQLRHHPTHVHHRIFVEFQRLACLSGLFLDQALDRITFSTREKARHQMRRLFEDITVWYRHTTEFNSSFESEYNLTPSVAVLHSFLWMALFCALSWPWINALTNITAACHFHPGRGW